VRVEFGFSSRVVLESDLTDGCFARGGWAVGRVGQLSGDGGRFAENGCQKCHLAGHGWGFQRKVGGVGWPEGCFGVK
jgi:hypothetical protein